MHRNELVSMKRIQFNTLKHCWIEETCSRCKLWLTSGVKEVPLLVSVVTVPVRYGWRTGGTGNPGSGFRDSFMVTGDEYEHVLVEDDG
jgi:hypothetical protein